MKREQNINENTSNKGISALMYSSLDCFDGSTNEVFQYLLNCKDIDINHKSKHGDTALIWTAMKGKVDLVELLLRKSGINVSDLRLKHELVLKLNINLGK